MMDEPDTPPEAGKPASTGPCSPAEPEGESTEAPSPRPRRRNPPPREWVRARRLWRQGYTAAEIADELGVSRQAVGMRRRAEQWPRGEAAGAAASARPSTRGESPAADSALRRAAALLDESAREAVREGDSARAAAEAEKLARLEKLIEESESRAGRSDAAGPLPDAEREALRKKLQTDLNRTLRAWVQESLRGMLRQDFLATDSREALAERLQQRIEILNHPVIPGDLAGWPIHIADVQRAGAGFWNNRYNTTDPETKAKLDEAARGRDPMRLLFGLIDGKCILMPWQRAPE